MYTCLWTDGVWFNVVISPDQDKELRATKINHKYTLAG